MDGGMGWPQSGVNLSGVLFASKSANFVGASEGSTTGYYTSPHKKKKKCLESYVLLVCLTSSVVMVTSLPTPPTSQRKKKARAKWKEKTFGDKIWGDVWIELSWSVAKLCWMIYLKAVCAPSKQFGSMCVNVFVCVWLLHFPPQEEGSPLWLFGDSPT